MVNTNIKTTGANSELKRNTKRISSAITHYKHIDSPIGKLLLAGNDKAVMLINFPTGSQARTADEHWTLDNGYFREATQQLNEYFAGTRKDFTFSLELDGTDFQKQAWKALRKVPYGTTVSYGELAKRIGNPNASRAIGSANHANPLPIVVPCHRVIGSDKSLTGFGGGLDTKRWLLAFEANGKTPTSPQADLFAHS